MAHAQSSWPNKHLLLDDKHQSSWFIKLLTSPFNFLCRINIVCDLKKKSALKFQEEESS